MPSGRVHSAATLSTSVVVLFLVRPISTAFLVSLGCLIGLFIHPDLDLGETYSFYLIRKKFGRVAYWIWKMYWFPFCWVTPHRHFISHFPVISTFIRFLYVMAPFLVFVVIFRPIWSINTAILPVFGGLVVVDALHWLMDLTSTKFKGMVRGTR